MPPQPFRPHSFPSQFISALLSRTLRLATLTDLYLLNLVDSLTLANKNLGVIPGFVPDFGHSRVGCRFRPAMDAEGRIPTASGFA